MAQILLGKEVTASLNEEIEEKVKTLKEHQVMPKLGIIRIGEKQDDIAYERNAVKRCEKLSVASTSAWIACKSTLRVAENHSAIAARKSAVPAVAGYPLYWP